MRPSSRRILNGNTRIVYEPVVSMNVGLNIFRGW
jgi:hypothetical protein